MKHAYSVIASIVCVLVFSKATARASLLGQPAIRNDLEDTTATPLTHRATATITSSDTAVAGQYIVVFDHEKVTNATTKALRMIQAYGNDDGEDDKTEIVWHYQAAFQGVTMRGVDDRMLAAIVDDPDVLYYEQVSDGDKQSYFKRNQGEWPSNRYGLHRCVLFLTSFRSTGC